MNGESVLDRAIRFRDLGYSVIPLDHPRGLSQVLLAAPGPQLLKGKRSILLDWLAYQSRRPTDHELNDWFGSDDPRNVGIVTGRTSNVVVVDLNGHAAVTYAQKHLQTTPMRVKTARGEHWYYRYPRKVVTNQAHIMTAAGTLQINVKGEGGYVVAPGSTHASGHVYCEIGQLGISVTDLPVYERILKTRETPFTPRSTGPHSPHDKLRLIADSMRQLFEDDDIGIFLALCTVNEACCSPPLDEDDVQLIACGCACDEPCCW